MEFIVIVGVVLLGAFIYKKLTKPNNSDKLTLLQLENWIRIYSEASLFEKSSMATSLIYQSAIVADKMGATFYNDKGVKISVNGLMRGLVSGEETSIEAVEHWLDYIQSEMTEDVPLEELNAVVARMVGAMVILRKTNSTIYRDVLRGNL